MRKSLDQRECQLSIVVLSVMYPNLWLPCFYSFFHSPRCLFVFSFRCKHFFPPLTLSRWPKILWAASILKERPHVPCTRCPPYSAFLFRAVGEPATLASNAIPPLVHQTLFLPICCRTEEQIPPPLQCQNFFVGISAITTQICWPFFFFFPSFLILQISSLPIPLQTSVLLGEIVRGVCICRSCLCFLFPTCFYFQCSSSQLFTYHDARIHKLMSLNPMGDLGPSSTWPVDGIWSSGLFVLLWHTWFPGYHLADGQLLFSFTCQASVLGSSFISTLMTLRISFRLRALDTIHMPMACKYRPLAQTALLSSWLLYPAAYCISAQIPNRYLELNILNTDLPCHADGNFS